MFGLYRRCCSIKDNISVNDSDNVSNLNTFTNSSNISTIPSSILYNRTYRSETGKIMNVLLLLFLVFGSCVVSFGMENGNENKENENKENEIKDLKKIENKDNDEINLIGVTLKNRHKTLNDIKDCIDYLSGLYLLLLGFYPCLITGIGGYNNTWKPLKENWGLYWYRSNLWLAYGLNKRIYDSNYIDVDLHILGINFLSFLEAIFILIVLCKTPDTYNTIDDNDYKIRNNFTIYSLFYLFLCNTFQILDFEIKVFKYWSISLNLSVLLLSKIFYDKCYGMWNKKNDMLQNNSEDSFEERFMVVS